MIEPPRAAAEAETVIVTVRFLPPACVLCLSARGSESPDVRANPPNFAAAHSGLLYNMFIRFNARRGQPAVARHDGPNDLERHLARCRRSGTAATLLVARLTDDAVFPADLGQHLRVSDSWMRSGPREFALLCDAGSLDRALVERRLCELVTGALRFGWAGFPDDGLVLEDLLATARGGAVAEPARRTRPRKLLVAER
jgi:hypothetical protein